MQLNMTDDSATPQSGASAPIPQSTTTMASTFMCNVSLPPKIEIHSGNNGDKFGMRMKK